MTWGRARVEEILSAREAFEKLPLDDLRPLAALVAADVPKRKTELVPLLADAITDPARVRARYARLEAASQNAVRAAVVHPTGRLDRDQFRAQFGEVPRFDEADPTRESWSYSHANRRKIKPTPLRLVFPRAGHLPSDTRTILRAFVAPPEAFAAPTRDAQPETLTLHETVWRDRKRERREWEEPVRVREMAAEAAADVRTVLRLIEAGKVRVMDKKRVSTEATRQAIAGVLSGGDFYAPDDADEHRSDPAFNWWIPSKTAASAGVNRFNRIASPIRHARFAFAHAIPA